MIDVKFADRQLLKEVNFVKNQVNMKFKVGDRVRFLNDQGGGIVTKVISSSLVNVRIEDGFEIPTVVSELIKRGKATTC